MNGPPDGVIRAPAIGTLDKDASAVLTDTLEAIQVEAAESGDEPLHFTGRTTRHSLPFVFGGQLLAQALWAAYRSVPAQRRVHLLHAHFVGRGNPGATLHLVVDRVQDGRNTSVRSVRVEQDSANGDVRHTVLLASATFGEDRDGLDHGAEPVSELNTDPSVLPTLDRWLQPHYRVLPEWWRGDLPIDLRYPEEPPHVMSEQARPRDLQSLWMKARGRLPVDPRLHDCLLVFASDLTLLDAVMIRHARSWYTGEVWAASLDHSVWFHRRARVDDWLLYEQRSPSAAGGRGLAVGEIFTRGGQHCATVTQLGVVSVDSERAMPH